MDSQMLWPQSRQCTVPRDMSGAKGVSGHHRVGIATTESILEGKGETCSLFQCISDPLMNVRLGLNHHLTDYFAD